MAAAKIVLAVSAFLFGTWVIDKILAIVGHFNAANTVQCTLGKLRFSYWNQSGVLFLSILVQASQFIWPITVIDDKRVALIEYSISILSTSFAFYFLCSLQLVSCLIVGSSEILVARFVHWMVTCSYMILMIQTYCSVDHSRNILATLVSCNVMLIAGLVASLTFDQPIVSSVSLTISLSAALVCYMGIYNMMSFLKNHFETHSESYRIIHVLRFFTLTCWSCFPVVWMITRLEFISKEVESQLYMFCDLLAKFVFVIALQFCHKDQMLSTTQTKVKELNIAAQCVNNQIEERERLTKEQNENERRIMLRFLLNHVGNPINKIALCLDQIKQLSKVTSGLTVGQDKLSDALSMLKASSKSMDSLCSDLITLESINSNSFEPTNISFSVSQLSRNVVRKFQGRHPKFQIDLLVEDDIPIVLGDKPRIVQVLNILLDNAIFYSDKIQRVIVDVNECPSIDKVADSEKFTYIRFFVKDYGIGIRTDDKPKVFQAFTDIRKSPKFTKEFKSGLSLSLAQKITSYFNGSLTFQSEYDVGSTFVFEVLLKINPSQKIEEVPNFSQSSDGSDWLADKAVCSPSMDLGRLRMRTSQPIQNRKPELVALLVDDDKMTLKLCTNIFKRFADKLDLQIQMHTATNGQIALDIAKCIKFDFICVDFMMPVMDGLEFAKKFIDIYKINPPVICLVSANAEPEVIQKFKKLQITQVIAKPVNLSKMQHIFENCVNSWKSQLKNKNSSTHRPVVELV